MKNNKHHSRLNVLESELLTLVIDRIENPANANNKQNLVDSLLLNMSSGIEHGYPVCSTGRMMRTIGALDKTDAEDIINMKPSWVIKDELSSVVSLIRNKRLDASSNAFIDKYNSGAEDNEIKDFIDGISKEVKNKCYHDYVKGGIMTETEVNLKLDSLLNNL